MGQSHIVDPERCPGVMQVGGPQRSPLTHLIEHLVQILGVLVLDPLQAAPLEVAVHSPSPQTVITNRDQRGLVTPVLEDLTRLPEPGVEGGAVVDAETGEEGHVVGAAEHIHRVELDESHPVHDPAEMTDVDAARRSGVGETLGAQRKAAGLVDGELSHRRAT